MNPRSSNQNKKLMNCDDTAYQGYALSSITIYYQKQ